MDTSLHSRRVGEGAPIAPASSASAEVRRRDRETSADSAESAVEALVRVLYEDLRAIAGRFIRAERSSTALEPTALVHEAYVRLRGQTNVPWVNRSHFLAVAARAMRQVLIERARRRDAEKRGGKGLTQVPLAEVPSEGGRDDLIDMLALDEALRELARRHARHARVVELRFFAGLTIAEVADVLGVSETTVENDWAMTRAWLGDRLRA